MMRALRFFLLTGLLLLSGATLAAPSDGRLKPNAEDFAKYHAFLRPRPEEEKWLQIPWMTDLWEARKKAAAQGKPILLWEMDGSPMACG
jgi:hypothetical protein